MKKNHNTLLKYIFNESVNIEYRKETIDGLFRAILDPVISNQKFESCILFKLNDVKEKASIFKRLAFSGATIYGFSDNLNEFGIENIQVENIWNDTEFVVILGQRYSAALLWDSKTATNPDSYSVCLLHNSKTITDIAKTIGENSSVDIKEYIQKYVSERRQNMLMNLSLRNIATLLNDKTEEIIFSENEKKHLVAPDDKLKTAEVVADKAKFIAHEIKNSLSIINLYSKILEKRLVTLNLDDELSTSINNSLKNIVNASENVSSLISDLRCLSTPYIQELNLKSLISNTILMCEEKANNAGVSINVLDLADVIVSTDKTKFQCALTNLIFNAIEACTKNSIVSVSSYEEENTVRISIKNNGEKIPDDIQEKIFQVDFTTKEKGNGLGLAICKQQMNAVCGDINLIHSNESETLFEIVLPL